MDRERVLQAVWYFSQNYTYEFFFCIWWGLIALGVCIGECFNVLRRHVKRTV